MGKQWFKSESNLPNMLRLFIETNRRLESSGQSMFNILPICRIKKHFITIDTSVLIGILRDCKVIKTDAKDVLNVDLWLSILHVPKVQGKGKLFTCTVDSDGLVVNVHFNRPKHQQLDVTETQNLKGKRVLGIDPGRSNIMTVVEEKRPGVYKHFVLTRRQYYAEAGIFKAREQSNCWNSTIQSELNQLTKCSPKSTRLSVFLEYLGVLAKVRASLWNEYTKKRWQEQRFRLYGGKKRVFANFLNRLEPSENTIIAYGSAKFQPGGQGELSVPTSRSFKECSYRFKVVPIDEFRTSKINWKTLEVLDTVAKRDENDELKTVRGLLWCRSTTQSEGKFIDRDINAAINIQRCAVLPRPPVLQRQKTNYKINQQIGKIISC